MKRAMISLLFILVSILYTFAQGEWETLKSGAGGWLTGLDIHPSGTPVYSRSDVGGAYKYESANNSWKQIVTSTSLPASDVYYDKNAGGVLSIVSAPSDSSVAYMAYYNTIYKSTDQGGNWVRTNFPNIEMSPNNDESKLNGERLAVDPLDEDVVYFGSINDGLYRTTNGIDWQLLANLPAGTIDRGIRSIDFDPSGGTIGGITAVIYVAIDGEGIYRSADAGNTWNNITASTFTNGDPWFYDIEIDAAGNVYAAGQEVKELSNGDLEYYPFGVQRYNGTSWSSFFAEEDLYAIAEIALDPFNNDRILVFSEGYSDTYRTYNASSTDPSWELVGLSRVSNNIPWLAQTGTTWFTLGEIAFDPVVADKIWVNWGVGTSVIIENGANPLVWEEQSVGQEHLVSNDIVSFSDGTQLTAHWDFSMFKHDVNNNYASIQLPSTRFNSTWDLAQSASDENFVVALVEDVRYCCFDEDTRSSSYSEDGGLSWTKFPSMPGDEFELMFGQLAVATGNNNNIVWLPGGNREPYVSMDKGTSWTQVSLPGKSASCCLDAHYFKRKILTADKVNPASFYIYDWGDGHIFTTTDGGMNWSREASVLPAWSFNAKLESVPGNANHLFWCNGPEQDESGIEGLMRSVDGGKSWTLLSNTDLVLNFALGKSAAAGGYPTIYIYGKVGGVLGYYRSTDEGSSWTYLDEYALDIYEWPSIMEADKDEFDKLYVGFAGHGFAMYSGSSTSTDPVVSERFHIDQFGYLPNSDKVAVISDPVSGFNSGLSYTPGSVLKLIDAATDLEVFSAAPTQWNGGSVHSQSGDRGWWFDFSSVTSLGEYYILDETSNTKSYNFEIDTDVYDDVLKDAVKMFYYNRCGIEKVTPYAGAKWTDSNSFLQDQQTRFISDPNNTSLYKDMSGGWFDAGDYNKYVTFTHTTIHDLLDAYETNPMVFSDNWDLPESGNGVPDLLDEINWELAWLEKMMNPDGSVHIKMGSRNYAENISSPPSLNTDPRYYGPVCSSASIATASMMAHAAHVYKTIPGLSSYATTLESKAIACFNYALPKLNNNTLDLACDDGSIVSGDADWDTSLQREKAIVAAIYLYQLTGSSLYGNYIINNINDAGPVVNGWWGPYTTVLNKALLKYTAMSNADATTASAIINSVTPHVSGDWDGFYGFNADDLYRSFMPDWSYHWGSNMAKARYGSLNRMMADYNINPVGNTNYMKRSAEDIHYFHGVNPMGIVYLSNMYHAGADKSANEIYHGWFADGTIYDNALTDSNGPAPGYLTGGPNANYTVSSNTPPFGQPQQKSYLDFNTSFPDNSWEITEPAIYYQAAYINLLANFASGQSVVPVELISFDAVAQDEDVLLSWVTESEINADRFYIEYSIDGVDWEEIDDVKAAGNTTTQTDYDYRHIDILQSIATDTHYYRLRIVDLDGSIEYSEVRSVNRVSTSVKELEIYPNPSNGILSINTLNLEKGATEISLTDMLGRVVWSSEYDDVVSQLDLSDLPNGRYILGVHLKKEYYQQKIHILK